MGIIGSFGDAAGHPVIDRATCTVCGECAGLCPGGVLSKGDGEILIDP
ncbi:MAG: 4Fe-4S binding protein, partial [Deltaproteobacteria bacterium]|nr:4Fe-4S binding protein [Deltaproteobacteria bacterium]